jgi:hypothetical protein
MSLTILDIKKYLTDLKKIYPNMITSEIISKFIISGTLSSTSTSSIISSKTFIIEIEQIRDNLREGNITIDFNYNGIMYFTTTSGTYYNIMQFFNKIDDTTKYEDPPVNSIKDHTYYDYYSRFRLLNLTININSASEKLIYNTDNASYRSNSKIKELYDFIVKLQKSKEIDHISYIHILKCFKYYYQMALIIINYAFINKIQTDFNNEESNLDTEFTDKNVQTYIKDQIKNLVINYAKNTDESQKTKIQDLVNLGHKKKKTYTYTFRLNPLANPEKREIYNEDTKYYAIQSQIHNITRYLANIKIAFSKSDGSASAVDRNDDFFTISNSHSLFTNIKTSITEIDSQDLAVLTNELNTYKTYIGALASFFLSINTLTDTASTTTIYDKALALDTIIDLADTNNDLKNILSLSDIYFSAEKTIANQIKLLKIKDLNEAHYTIVESQQSIPISLILTQNAKDATIANIKEKHLGITYHKDSTNLVQKYDITKRFHGFSVQENNLKGIKYYIKNSIDNKYKETTVSNIELPSSGTLFIKITRDGYDYLFIEITFRDDYYMLFTLFKENNGDIFENIFSQLFNANANTEKFGNQLITELTSIRDKYKAPTTSAIENECIIDILFSDLSEPDDSGSSPERTKFIKLGLLTSNSIELTDIPKLKFSLTTATSTNYLYTKNKPSYFDSISSYLDDPTKIQILNNYFNYHAEKKTVNDYLSKVVGAESTSAPTKIEKYISQQTAGGDFDTSATSNKEYNDSKDSIKHKNDLYKKNVDKYKTKNNELNNILKNNLYNNIFLYITIVVLILICLGLIYINNHKASLKTQYSVMLIAFLLLYYIIYTNVTFNITETFASSSKDIYLQKILNLHLKISTFVQLNINDKNIENAINKSLNKEKSKYDGFVKLSNSKLNSLELVLNDEFINAIKSKELVKFLILFTAICIISYIIYTNTEDPTITSIIFIILFVIILTIYFYNINLMTRTKADAKYWNN